MQAKVLQICQDLGVGAQFGGKYFAHDAVPQATVQVRNPERHFLQPLSQARVVRLPRLAPAQFCKVQGEYRGFWFPRVSSLTAPACTELDGLFDHRLFGGAKCRLEELVPECPNCS